MHLANASYRLGRPVQFGMALASSGDEWRVCWRDFANRSAKNAQWIVAFLVSRADTPEGLFATFSANRDPALLDSLEQFGFYLGCYGHAHWGEPVRVIEKEQAQIVLYAAHAISTGGKPSVLDTADSIEMWSDSLQGCFRCTAVVANNRFVDFLKRTRAMGILLEGEGIPPGVALEFMSTVLYISENETATDLVM